MKKICLLCLVVVVSFSLYGCGEKAQKEQKPQETTKVTYLQKEKDKYEGKYVMRNLPPKDEEIKKLLEEAGEKPDVSGEKLLEDGLSHEDLGIKSEVLCIEIKDDGNVNVCIGGFQAKEAKLLREDGKVYIKLESPCFNGFTDKILLGEKEVDGKNYLTFEDENGKRAYFEMAKNDKIVSNIDIESYRNFTATGIFQIDPQVTEKQTGKNPYDTWGSGFRTYGSSMKINEDKTGSYSIGVGDYNNFKLEKSLKSGLTSMIIVNEQGLMVPHKGSTFVLDAQEIDGQNYLVFNQHDLELSENLIVSYWKCIDENQIVFETQDGRIMIWG